MKTTDLLDLIDQTILDNVDGTLLAELNEKEAANFTGETT